MPEHPSSVTRRAFLKRVGTASALVTAGGLASPRPASASEEDIEVPAELRCRAALRVNGSTYHLVIPNRTTLLEALREEIGLTGAKLGCDRGHCGACTVLVDGRPVYACSQLAASLEGRDILTVEGLEKNGALDSVQEAFIAADAMQCGYCIPGQIMSARALLDGNPQPGTEDVREALCGNLCRCGAYMNFLKALTGGVKRRA